jgi:hypothetical protein
MTSRISPAIILLACIGSACARSEPGSAADSTPAAVPASPAVTASAAATCWVRGGGTTADAAARPSPLGEVRFTLGGHEALLCYSRPSAKGRPVMGGLVPYGEPWRLGANEATSIHLPFNATIGGTAVDAGTYSIYAVPGQSEWEFVLNRQVERWGIPIDDAIKQGNAGSFKRPVATTAAPVEQLTIQWKGTSDTAGELVVEWEKTQLTIPIERR